jgi:hypothetical protein
LTTNESLKQEKTGKMEKINSKDYWERRYASGGDSGDGSKNQLAEFKAQVLNKFVSDFNVESIIEFGCGDGSQLELSQYTDISYRGYDVSVTALNRCRDMFYFHNHKTFHKMEDYSGEKAELAISLDVIYHLIEDSVFETYMHCLFQASKFAVIIYSSNDEKIPNKAAHVKHRCFAKWVVKNKNKWELQQVIKNPYPWKGKTETGSFSDFYIYTKKVV